MSPILHFLLVALVASVFTGFSRRILGAYLSHVLLTGVVMYAAVVVLGVNFLTVVSCATFIFVYSTWSRVGRLLYKPDEPTVAEQIMAASKKGGGK